LIDLRSNEIERLPPDFEIPPEEIHVWILNTAGQKRAWDRLLSPDEATAANRLSSPYQLRFKNRRGALRLLLSRYLRLNPTSVEFVVGPNGKPYVAGGQFAFNVSHTGDLALIAVGRGCDIGVDLERLETITDSTQLAAQFFREEEIEALSRASPTTLSSMFLTMWVRKEAVLKAEGIGIGSGLKVLVPHLTLTHAAKVELKTGEIEQRSFYIYDINPTPSFVGALAVSRRASRIVERIFED
jgi:4'-phosphopantetheinyl transferase